VLTRAVKAGGKDDRKTRNNSKRPQINYIYVAKGKSDRALPVVVCTANESSKNDVVVMIEWFEVSGYTSACWILFSGRLRNATGNAPGVKASSDCELM
jgi:hypothetical protein